jgi:hypothetical protein
MATARERTAQQRDARELALSRPTDPYRGAMLDPFSDPAVPASAAGKAKEAGEPETDQSAVPPLARVPLGTPAAATAAGLLGLALSLAMALFGISLLALLSLQSDYGAPDRSFYRGADSGSAILALIDFALSAGCGLGGVMLMGGRVIGRIAMTVSGWVVIDLAAFWLLRGHASSAVALSVGVAAVAMLLLSYQRSVTRWLGVLPPPQPS